MCLQAINATQSLISITEGSGGVNFGSVIRLEDADSVNSNVTLDQVIVEVISPGTTPEFLLVIGSHPDIQVVIIIIPLTKYSSDM